MHVYIKRWASVFAALIIGILWATPAHAGPEDFVIDNFEADYYLSRDEGDVSVMRVREKIVAEFPSFDQNHGILRAIPQTYQGHSLEVRVQKVTDGRHAWQYETYDENGNTVIKIGDPALYVHGAKTYIIDYTVRGVDSTKGETQQLFWNINGTQWLQPFRQVTARVHLEGGLAAAAQADQLVCYTGTQGSTAADCKITTQQKDQTKVVTFTTTRPLTSHQTLSVVVPFPLKTFAPYTPSLRLIIEWVALGVAIALPPLSALFYMVHRWRRFGLDPKGKGVVVPQYLQPKEVSVLGANGVFAEGFEPKAISATIIDLAVRHYIKVYEVQKKQLIGSKTDFQLELIKDTSDLRPDEKQVVDILFGQQAAPGAKISMEEIGKSSAYHTKASGVGEFVAKQLTTEGYFKSNPNSAKMPYLIAGIVVTFSGFLFIPWTAGLLVAGVIMMIGSQAMAARTLKGVELREYLLGLREYIKLAEAERLRVLQSPRGDLTEKIRIDDTTQLVKLYEKLLPYAMLFGLEKEWAQEFGGLYQVSPDWYSGSQAFNAGYFASSMHNFGTAATSSFSPPGSSGGGAGGGGGGGGGGGW